MDQRGDQPLQAQLSPRRRAYNILAQVAQARSTVYGWLSLCFYRPDEALLAALADGTVAAELTACTGWLGHDQQRLLRSEEHTSELQSRENLVCRLLLEKKKE